MFFLGTSPGLFNLGITVIRIGMGILFIGHGSIKATKGVSEWRWTGEQMAHLGITFAPLFWGICAVLAELVGGICLTLGLGTRIASAFLAFTMLVAVVYHMKKGDSYGYISFPLSQMIVFIGLMIAGGGSYSLDHYLFELFTK